jgi:hypothetical protein
MVSMEVVVHNSAAGVKFIHIPMLLNCSTDLCLCERTQYTGNPISRATQATTGIGPLMVYRSMPILECSR